MENRYGDYDNVVMAHDMALSYGGIVGYTYSKENGYGLRQWGLARDVIAANKFGEILKEMADEQNSS